MALALAVGGLGMRSALAGAQLGEAFLQPVLLAGDLPQLAAAVMLIRSAGRFFAAASLRIARSAIRRASAWSYAMPILLRDQAPVVLVGHRGP
ncbi:hypothetical protein [Streptomyces sp. NBC_00239]|uniref:hypothetical protein n=1 Tax=Streptomyces sp. NBC_00239 TaxID=2903640 RepID=UPI002E2B3EC9|nr:hypothetical protein [Streptomyces sp. NBC_00239]